MGEKGGGKGFSLPKSSLKSTPLSGKDDTSAKSKRGRKVQFDSPGYENVSSKFGEKDGFPTAKGSKGGSQANGKTGKPTVSKPSELDRKVEQELPKNAKCLMDCEAAEILGGIKDHMVILSEDPTIKIPISFDRGLQYAKSSGQYKNTQSVRRILQTLIKHGVSDGEVCMIANIFPETVDEVFALIPSLKAKRSKLRDPINAVLSELAKLQCQKDIPDIF